MKISRMYTSNNGHSCFDEIEIEFPNKIHSGILTDQFLACGFFYYATFLKNNKDLGKLHNPSTSLLLVHLSGKAEIVSSTGESRIFFPGSPFESLCLMEATTGKGHGYKVIEEPVCVLAIKLEKNDFYIKNME